MLDQVRASADDPTPVLIQGETGTGKELVARALHRLGPRQNGPFITLNCAAVPADLLERELFGHVRGAYTGAHETRGGLFEAADGGILFLDEIGEASPSFQARLLRVIEEQAVRRLGDPRLRPVDVRVVAATNRHLEQAVEQGRFRQDLYYRLKGVLLAVPPLRQRREEIPFLVHHALQRWAERHTRQPPVISRQTMEVLLACDWPGNVRELIHTLERAAGEAADRPIAPQDLSLGPLPGSAIPNPPAEAEQIQRLLAALQASGGNRSEAARRLGINRTTLYRHLRRLGLEDRRE